MDESSPFGSRLTTGEKQARSVNERSAESLRALNSQTTHISDQSEKMYHPRLEQKQTTAFVIDTQPSKQSHVRLTNP